MTAYLDWNATAPLRLQARAAMIAALDLTANPSAVHGAGRAARQMVEQARHAVATLVGAATAEVVFTSGGTEANTLALDPTLGETLLVSAVEHPAVLCGGRFPGERVRQIPTDTNGAVDCDRMAAMLAEAPRPLVSVMLANNETGVIQPIRQIADRVHAAGGLLHVDGVQGVGKIPVDVAALGVDLLTITSHKIGGPMGVGALIRRGTVAPQALVRGGGQERGFRAGTENVAAIAGLGAAALAAKAQLADEQARSIALRDCFEAELLRRTPDVTIFGRGVPRLPNTSLFAHAGIKAETAVIAFDLAGIAVSSGSACSSGKVAASHVLLAMGVDPALGQGAIRMSLGPTTTEAEIEAALATWEMLAKSLYKDRKPSGIAA